MPRNDLSIYDANADRWWDDTPGFLQSLKNLVPARLDYIERLEGGWGGMRVLDLGCGGGYMSEALARSGAEVIGVDPAAQLLQAAQAHADGQGLNVAYRVGVGEAVPVEDGSMDRVVCVDVLEHVADPQVVIREVARCLRPGGRFVFDTINRNPIARILTITLAEDLLGLVPQGIHDPELYIKPKELRAMLIKAGLTPRGFEGLGPVGIPRGERGQREIRFGRVPSTVAMYLGHADKPA